MSEGLDSAHCTLWGAVLLMALSGCRGSDSPAFHSLTGQGSSVGLARPGAPTTLVIDETGAVPIEAWDDLPTFVRVRAYAAGGWSLALQCE